MTKTDLAWLAGWLEGEGCFNVSSGAGRNGRRYFVARIVVTSTDLDVLEHAQGLVGGSVSGPHKSYKRLGTKPVWTWALSAQADVLALLRKLQPLMVSERRQAQAQHALDALVAYRQVPHGQKGQ